MKLLIAIVVLLTPMVPAAEAAPERCSSTAGGLCPKLDLKPNHICYLPDASRSPEDICELPVGILGDNPPRPIPAPWPITFRYAVHPVDGPPHGFVAVPGNHVTIAAGATGGVVPVQLVPGSPLPEEQAMVLIYHANDPVLVSAVLITRR